MIKQDLTMGENEFIMIDTPEGLVAISTILGTSVMIYDDPDHNPTGHFFLRQKPDDNASSRP